MSEALKFSSVRKALKKDVKKLAPNLREADRTELFALNGQQPEQELENSFLASDKCWTIEWQKKVVGMFGVSPKSDAASDVAFAWLLASDDLDKIAFRFLKECHYWIEEMQKGRRILMNYVDARNQLTITWLKWLGFEFIKLHENFGINGEAFWEFRRVRNVGALRLPYMTGKIIRADKELTNEPPRTKLLLNRKHQSSENPHKILGSATWLAMQSEFYNNWKLQDLKGHFLPPIELGQCIIFHKGNTPIGFVSWALFDESAEAAWRDKTRLLNLEDWQSGDQLWFIDFIAPFGGVRKMVRAVRNKFYGQKSHGQIAWSLRQNIKGEIIKISLWK